jgi:hypothetical protein
MKKICYFVDTTDNHIEFVGVFEDNPDKEEVASAINLEIASMGFLDSYSDPEKVMEIGISLAYTNYAQYGDYEFAIQSIKELKI